MRRIFMLILALATGIEAGETKASGGEKPLSLRDCIRIALETSPLSEVAEKGLKAATEAVGEARAAYYPEAAFQGRYAHWQQRAFLPSGLSLPGRPTPTLIGPTDDWLIGVKMRFTLFDGGERRAQYRAALARKEMAEEEKARVRQELILGIHQGFYGVAAALETLKAAEQNCKRAADHLRLAEERKAVGAVSRSDVLRVEVEKANAELALVRAENWVRTAKGNLNTIMGRSAESPLEIDLSGEDRDPEEIPDLQKALQEAWQRRPEIRAAERRVEAGREGVKAAQSTFAPKVRVEGSYGRRDTEVFLEDEEWLAGISLEWPLFSGFLRTHRLVRAKAEKAKEEALLRQEKLKVRQEVWNAHSKWMEAWKGTDTAKRAVRQAEESLRLARERYEVGAGTVAELLDAEAALVRAQAAQIEAQWDLRQAEAVFRKAVGRIGEEDVF